jgi:hypothetical protein
MPQEVRQMVPIDAIVSLESTRLPAAHQAPLCQAGPRRLAADKDDLVITPGGPRPREQVRPVKPGEVVRQNEDGTFTIVPKQEPNSSKPKGKTKKKD